MTISSICVCGAGTMGRGIAQVAAQSGLPVLLYDLDEQVLVAARSGIAESLDVLVRKEKISAADRDHIFSRIHFTTDLQVCRADVLIEAIIEKPEAKIDLFNQLAALNREESIFATNTSSLAVTSIAEKMISPGRVIGMHFFNPAPVMKLVEVVRTKYNTDDTVQAIADLARRMGKVPVICKDAPGFIVNRVARPYYIEALRLVEEGRAGFGQLDALMEASGFKLGPFRLMDLIGNDINYAVSCSVYEQLGRPVRLKPSDIQKEKVAGGQLGRKTKKGYYNYE